MRAKDIPKDKFIEICNLSQSMVKACAELGLRFTTFKKYAILYNCYKTNQSGKGTRKNIPKRKNVHEYLIKGVYFSSLSSLKNKLVEAGLLKYECEKCENKGKWLDKNLILILDHIDGDRMNNELTNLRFLCPNCNSQTSTFCGRNKRKN